MNKVILLGRLTRDPDIRYTQGGQSVARYTLAVNRSYRRENDPTADFINITAFGNRAEFAKKYFRKGQQVAVVGEIRTSSYDKDGVRHYSTEVLVSEQFFAEGRTSSEGRAQGDFGGDFAPAPDNGSFYGGSGYQDNYNQYNSGYNGNNGYNGNGYGNGGYNSNGGGYQNNGYSNNAFQGQNNAGYNNFAQSANNEPAQGTGDSPEGFTPVDSITEDQDLPF